MNPFNLMLEQTLHWYVNKPMGLTNTQLKFCIARAKLDLAKQNVLDYEKMLQEAKNDFHKAFSCYKACEKNLEKGEGT